MRKSATKAGGPKHGTVLTCHAPRAAAVWVAGMFNNWAPTATPMTRDADGMWAVGLDLPPGRHEYKFVVDGRWCCEPGCEEPSGGCAKCVPNPFGSMNRVVEVSE